jgi:hypothetical protein
MRRLLVVLALATFGCGSSAVAPARALRAPLSTPPSPRDALAALGAHADVQATDLSCESVANGDITLGGIEAHLLGQLAEADSEDEASLIARCEGEQAPWSCEVGARIVAEGDPWDYRITFSLSADGAIDPASIRCPGTG